MSAESRDNNTSPPSDPLIREIRENFDYCVESWKEIREEGKIDMQYIAGDPWDPADKDARKGRPTVAPDELGQYINQANNNLRQNPRAVRVVPEGEGANDQTALFKQGMIRGIEYKSNAQECYITGFENAVSRSYGFWGLTTRYVSDNSSKQEIAFRRFPNADAVYLDPDIKRMDGSDMGFAYVLDIVPRKHYKRRFPKAKITDFSMEQIKEAPAWIKDDYVQVAEYWKVDVNEEIEEFDSIPRKVQKRKVCQYITNGLEVLEENEWAGKYIPIIPVFGKEIYVDHGGGSKRMLYSLIRLARPAYKAYCFICSQELEEASLSPKVPWVGYEGQFEGHEDEWAYAHQQPIGYLQAKPTVEGAPGPLPIPQRTQFVPNFQAYEFAKESWKRAIQSAVGMFNSSVGRHDTNAKSGKAIQELDQQSDEGTFHFMDNFNKSLEHTGRVLLDLIPRVYPEAREVGIREEDETHKVIRINDPQYVDPATQKPAHYDVDAGQHDVTVSTGPSFQSQRDAADSFLDLMVSNLEALPIDPAIKGKLLSLSIKMKNLGPLGDQMAKLLDPQQDQNQTQQQLAKLIQAHQALNAYAQQMEGMVQKLTFEKNAKVVENQTRAQIEKWRIDSQVAIAEIQTKAQNEIERLKMLQQVELELHGSAHEAGLSAQEHAQDLQLASQQHQQAMQQGDQAAANQSALSAQEAAQQPQGEPNA